MADAMVVNRRTEEFVVYIGRGSKWGNPFAIDVDMSRDQVILAYAEWIVEQDHLMEALHELQGKRLGCWCKPLACHGDVLVRLVEKKLGSR